ncbi:glycosyltransferase [Sciscionella sediminilitoris]|uniref:glycosyltransferase n=1 Tax=Sciscionella sediminilitoris TaxID=1445613 RepID=UPI0004DF8D90|nr:glycosyltransferase [Sciscionella sp. SE31]
MIVSSSNVPHEDRALRVLIAADTFAPNVNGAARFAERLASGLAGRGHLVHVACPSADGAERVESFGEATVHRIRSRRIPVHEDFRICLPWQANAAAERILARVRPDIVHAQSHFLVGRAMLRAAERNGIPAVATNHFMPENLLAYAHLPRMLHRTAMRLAWRDLGRVFGTAATVTTPTERAAELLRDNGFPAPVRAVSCGIDTESYRGHGSVRPGTVLFVGRLDQEKRVEELLAAVARIEPGIAARVEIIGDGPCRAELERRSRELGIAERVTFHGFVSEQELRAAYARAEVFCMPGIAELQSLATLEAMSAGTAILAANAVALPHLVREGENGWLFTPGDVTELAEKLRAVLGTPGTSMRMGEASGRLAAGHALEKTLATFEEIYTAQLPAPREPARVLSPAA